MTRTTPRMVFGMPAYGRVDALPQALESLLAQTRSDLAVVIVDDRPSPEVQAIVESYAAADARVHYEANPQRLGMTANWRHAFDRSRALFPESEYFAWASDHDVWHPRWLEVLSGVMDAQPHVVLAHPQVMRVYRKYRRRVNANLVSITGPSRRSRMVAAATTMTAGNAVYGLFRARAMERAGVFRPVLLPDRQLLVELALYGELVQIPEILWYREVAGGFSYDRQRRMLFAGRPPLHTRLPVNVQHAAVLGWDLAVCGRGRPEFGRIAGAGYAAAHLWETTLHALARGTAELRSRLRPEAAPDTTGPAAAEADPAEIDPGNRVKTEV